MQYVCNTQILTFHLTNSVIFLPGCLVPARRRDAVRDRVQSQARCHGKEDTRGDRVAVSGSEQFRHRGIAALERDAQHGLSDAGTALALAPTALKLLRQLLWVLSDNPYRSNC